MSCTSNISGSLPIQTIIQAAFFIHVWRRFAVACRCLITRERLYIHIDICDTNGGLQF